MKHFFMFCSLLAFSNVLWFYIKGVFPSSVFQPVVWEEVLSSLEVDRSVGEVDWAQPGSCGGMAMLESFIDQRLRLFATHRNNPNCDALSHLSPWIHAGQFALRLSAFFIVIHAVQYIWFEV